MNAMDATKARANLFKIMSFVNDNSQPLTLTNSNGKNAVLVGQNDWNAIQETMYLNSVPGMTESLIKGKKYPFSRLSFRRWSRVAKMYLIKYDKQATKDIKNLKSAKLDGKAKSLIEILWKNPLEPPYEELVGNLAGLYSRRINIQHRLVYEIFDEEVTVGDVKYEGTVKIIRMWTPTLGCLEKEWNYLKGIKKIHIFFLKKINAGINLLKMYVLEIYPHYPKFKGKL